METNILLDKILIGIGLKTKKIYLNFNVIKIIAILFEYTYHFLRIKKEPILTKYGVGVLSFNQTLDISLATKLLGYKPLHTIEEGIEKYSN